MSPRSTVAPSAVTLTHPYGSDTYSGIASIPINLTLANGTYYIGVIPVMNYGSAGAEIGIYNSSYGGTPGDSNAYQVNPGGGFGYIDGELALGTNAAYRILAASSVPEPSVPMLVTVGLAALFGARRWKRKRGQPI